MKAALTFGVGLTLAAISLAAPAITAAPPLFVAEMARTVTGGRDVQVLVAQSEIKTDINPSNIAVATGGGLLGGLLAAAQDASRAKKAEAAIEPVRAALTGFDADTLALDTTKAAIANAAWLQPAKVVLSKDASLLGKSAMLDNSGAAQIVFVEYSFDLSPDFANVRVGAKLEFANKAQPASSPKPEARLSPKNLVAAQAVTSVVSLPAPGGDLDANAALWSSDGGKRIKAALVTGFAQMQKLITQSLALSAADIESMNAKTKPKGAAGGFAGRVQESPPPGTLLWAGRLIHAQPLP